MFYEIYPRSFQDTNGDGVGDLNGITQRLDYLKNLGIDAIWIAPCFPSSLVDFGYDVSNYEDIDLQFGTLADFDRLVAEAKKRDIRILLGSQSHQRPASTGQQRENGPAKQLAQYAAVDKSMITLGRTNPVLIAGAQTSCDAGNDHVVAYTRSLNGETIVVLTNFSDQNRRLRFGHSQERTCGC